jgi:hypothetical protein
MIAVAPSTAPIGPTTSCPDRVLPSVAVGGEQGFGLRVHVGQNLLRQVPGHDRADQIRGPAPAQLADLRAGMFHPARAGPGEPERQLAECGAEGGALADQAVPV